MNDVKAKKFRGDGLGFDVVELGEDRDKEVEVRAVVVLSDERNGGRGRMWRFRTNRER